MQRLGLNKGVLVNSASQEKPDVFSLPWTVHASNNHYIKKKWQTFNWFVFTYIIRHGYRTKYKTHMNQFWQIQFYRMIFVRFSIIEQNLDWERSRPCRWKWVQYLKATIANHIPSTGVFPKRTISDIVLIIANLYDRQKDILPFYSRRYRLSTGLNNPFSEYSRHLVKYNTFRKDHKRINGYNCTIYFGWNNLESWYLQSADSCKIMLAYFPLANLLGFRMFMGWIVNSFPFIGGDVQNIRHVH